MKDEFKPTETEKNILCFLRTRKPFEMVKLFCDINGRPDFWRVEVRQDLVITSLGIEEIACKK